MVLGHHQAKALASALCKTRLQIKSKPAPLFLPSLKQALSCFLLQFLTPFTMLHICGISVPSQVSNPGISYNCIAHIASSLSPCFSCLLLTAVLSTLGGHLRCQVTGFSLWGQAFNEMTTAVLSCAALTLSGTVFKGLSTTSVMSFLNDMCFACY